MEERKCQNYVFAAAVPVAVVVLVMMEVALWETKLHVKRRQAEGRLRLDFA